MKLKNILIRFAFCWVAFATPALALGSPDSHAANEDSAHGDGHGGHQGLNWIDFNNKHAPPMVALLINFAVVVFLVTILLRKGLNNRFKNRKESLQTEIEEARKMKEAAEAALKEARAKMDSLDAEMAKIKQDILDAGQSESKKIVGDAKAMGERLSSDALIMVEQEVARLTQEIRAEIVEEVIELAKQLVREKISDEDQDRILSNYLLEITPATSSINAARPDGEAR